MNKKSVMVGMSGGVDSSVAAAILKEKEYEVLGYTLKFGAKNNKCCLIDDARQVADDIGIDYITIDIHDEFEEKIVQYFINQYLGGKTPSPCPRCNLFKFGLGIEYAKANNIDYVSTGHYAKVKNNKLYTASTKKDQAYFLSRLPKNYFKKIILPLGEMSKDKVRNYAKKYNLHVAQKDDSQDICFVENDYRDFLKKRGIEEKKGDVLDKKKNKIAEHKGYFNYTIGQRFKTGGLPHKMYVLDIKPEENILIVGENEDLYSKNLRAKEFNLLADRKYLEKSLYLKARSGDSFHKCQVVDRDNGFISVEFDKRVRAVTCGQLAVLYYKQNSDEYLVIGSGWITGC